MNVDTLATWIQEIIGSSVTVVIGINNTPLPSGEFLVIQEIASMSNEYPQIEVTDGTAADMVNVNLDVEEKNTYQIDAYAEDGKNVIRLIIAAAHHPACPQEIILNNWSDIRDLSQLEDSGFAYRYQADLDFSFAHRDTIADDEVMTIHATGDFAGIASAAGEEEPTS